MDVKLEMSGLMCFARTKFESTGVEGIVALAVNPAKTKAEGGEGHAHHYAHEPHIAILSIPIPDFFGSPDFVSTRYGQPQMGHWLLDGWNVSFELGGGTSSAPVRFATGNRRRDVSNNRLWARERPSVDDHDSFDISWIPDFDRIIGKSDIKPECLAANAPLPAPVAARIFLEEGSCETQFRSSDELDVYEFPDQPAGGVPGYAQSLSDRLRIRISRRGLMAASVTLTWADDPKIQQSIGLTTSSPELAVSCLPCDRPDAPPKPVLEHFEAHYRLLQSPPAKLPLPTLKRSLMMSLGDVGSESLQPVRCSPVWFP